MVITTNMRNVTKTNIKQLTTPTSHAAHFHVNKYVVYCEMNWRIIKSYGCIIKV